MLFSTLFLEICFLFDPQDYAEEFSDGHNNPLDSGIVPKEGVSILKGTSRKKITFVGVLHW